MITLTESMLSQLSYFKINEEEQGPIEAKFDVGNHKLVLITGENATGKSFVRRLYCGLLRRVVLRLFIFLKLCEINLH
jgi:ABC-type transport system involved in cytochrome c biogenesis ATPase subunit